MKKEKRKMSKNVKFNLIGTLGSYAVLIPCLLVYAFDFFPTFGGNEALQLTFLGVLISATIYGFFASLCWSLALGDALGYEAIKKKEASKK